MSESTGSHFRKSDWAIYFGLLTATFVAVLVATGSFVGASLAAYCSVLVATHAAYMVSRAYRTRDENAEVSS